MYWNERGNDINIYNDGNKTKIIIKKEIKTRVTLIMVMPINTVI